MVDRKAMLNFLHRLPRILDELAQQAIVRIKSQSHNASRLGMRILMWLVYAMRPLRSRELEHAIFSTELGSDGLDLDNDNLIEL